jgi:hypothetical protein
MSSITSDFFPATIADRSGPAPSSFGGSAGAGAIHIPRTRLFPFVVSSGANLRSSVSTPMLKGPAIVKALFVEFNSGADPPDVSFELGYAPAPVVENDVSRAARKQWSAFSEKVDETAPIVSGVHQGFIQWSLFNIRPRAPWPLNQLVTLGDFCLVMTSVSAAAIGNQCVGWVEVIEDIDPQALAGFR